MEDVIYYAGDIEDGIAWTEVRLPYADSYIVLARDEMPIEYLRYGKFRLRW